MVSELAGRLGATRTLPLAVPGVNFLKVFLDPDGDGKKYLEFHINALGNINDVWIGQGSKRTDRQDLNLSPENYHLEWDCANLKSAVNIRGTLNNPEDVDKGWGVELAFPWTSLSSFADGRCPPSQSSTWRAHLGRVYRVKDAGKPCYWTWPVIGIPDCRICFAQWRDAIPRTTTAFCGHESELHSTVMTNRRDRHQWSGKPPIFNVGSALKMP